MNVTYSTEFPQYQSTRLQKDTTDRFLLLRLNAASEYRKRNRHFDSQII